MTDSHWSSPKRSGDSRSIVALRFAEAVPTVQTLRGASDRAAFLAGPALGQVQGCLGGCLLRAMSAHCTDERGIEMSDPSRVRRRRRVRAAFACALCFLPMSSALALQPLSTFLAGGRTWSTEGRAARLGAEQQAGTALGALGRVLPSVSARASYTRNEHEATLQLSGLDPSMQDIVLQAGNQYDAYLQVDVPVFDGAGWASVGSARASARGAEADAAATALEIDKRIASQYYQLVGGQALRGAAERMLAAAQQLRIVARERRAKGIATDLEVNRATAEVSRAGQEVASAELAVELARRALRTLSGVDPDSEIARFEDDLRGEDELEVWERRGLQSSPGMQAAREHGRSAELADLAARLAFAPTIVASAQEHFTNAAGFAGTQDAWVATITATWKVDLALLGAARAQSSAADVARVKEEEARQRTLDLIHDAWCRVRAGIAKSRVARAELDEANTVVAQARERYQRGACTQLDVVQAERDAFSAEVSRIRADADLASARTVLRASAGISGP